MFGQGLIPWNSGKFRYAWYPQAGMVLRYECVEYHFDYDFAPNDGTDRVATSTMIDGEILDGQIFITGIWVGDKPRPVTVEVLGLMKQAAGRDELARFSQLRQRLAQEAERRRAQISLVPRRG
jgi:hypothetical protein